MVCVRGVVASLDISSGIKSIALLNAQKIIKMGSNQDADRWLETVKGGTILPER